MSYGFKSAIASHVGMVRMNNQDSGFAGNNLFFVADGMGGHAGGDVASALVTKDVSGLEPFTFESPEDAAKKLEKRLLEANNMLSRTVITKPDLAGMGTTFCGFIAMGDKIAVAHIGDSRLYLLRDKKLKQITKDHTFVQRLVDSGRITEEEAATHPRRSVLMRVLGDVDSSPDIDTLILPTLPGDIWLLCSDGLCGYVEDQVIENTLNESASLDIAVDSLIETTLRNGAPDNVTIALVETIAEAPETVAEPKFVGSAAKDGDKTDTRPITRFGRITPPRRIRKMQPVEESHFEPRVDEYLAELIAETKRQARNRRIMIFGSLLLVIGLFAGFVFMGYQWTQTRYFVGTDGTNVIIYQGVQQNIGSFSLSTPIEDTKIPISSLTPFQQRQIERTLDAASLQDAREIVVRIGGESYEPE